MTTEIKATIENVGAVINVTVEGAGPQGEIGPQGPQGPPGEPPSSFPASSLTGVVSIANGGTGVSSMEGTDYSVNRPRGIILQATEPESVPDGCIVGVYE